MPKDSIDVEKFAEEKRLGTIFDETVKEELSGGAKSPGLIDYLCDNSGSEIKQKAIYAARDIARNRPVEPVSRNSSNDDTGSWMSESKKEPQKSTTTSGGEEVILAGVGIIVSGIILGILGNAAVLAFVLKLHKSELRDASYLDDTFLIPACFMLLLECIAIGIKVKWNNDKKKREQTEKEARWEEEYQIKKKARAASKRKEAIQHEKDRGVAMEEVNNSATSQTLKDGYWVGRVLHGCISYGGNIVSAKGWLEIDEVVKKYPSIHECCALMYIDTESVSAERFYEHMRICISRITSDEHADFVKGMRYGRRYGG